MDSSSLDELCHPVRLEWREDSRAASTASTGSHAPPVDIAGFRTHQARSSLTFEVVAACVEFSHSCCPFQVSLAEDTLASIAIKYHVSIADLKRFNGIISDLDLYTKDMVLIPTKLVPVGEDVLGIFAEVARDPGLVSRALHMAEGSKPSHPESRSNDSYPPRWCRCGLCSEDDDPSFSCKRHQRDQGDNVELVRLSSIPEPTVSASSRINEHIRRRRGSVGMEDEDVREDMAFQSAMEKYTLRGKGQESGGNGGNAGSKLFELRRQSMDRLKESKGAAVAFFSSLGKAIGDSNLTRAIEQGGASIVEKIRKVASQPALGSSGTSSLRDAADGVLLSLKQGLLPKGPLPLPLSTAASAGRPPRPPLKEEASSVKRGKCD